MFQFLFQYKFLSDEQILDVLKQCSVNPSYERIIYYSNFSDEEKIKAYKSLCKRNINVCFKGIIFFIMFASTMFSSLFDNSKILNIISLISGTIFLLFLLIDDFIKPFLINKKSWNNISKIIEFGYDGLTDEEINLIGPTKTEIRKIIAIKMLNGILSWIPLVMIAILLVDFSATPIKNFIGIGISFAIAFCTITLSNKNKEKIEKMVSRYQKDNLSYICPKCGSIVIKTYEEMSAKPLSIDENDKRFAACPKCKEHVFFPHYYRFIQEHEYYSETTN